MMAGRDPEVSGVAGMAGRHVPVLIEEVLRALEPVDGGIFIDGTFGAGGYSRAMLASGAAVIGIDRDASAIAGGVDLKSEFGDRLTLVEGNFSDLDAISCEVGHEKVDGVVLDIGVSSMQIDDPTRGFSFRNDGPLDMRMGGEGPSAAEIVNRMETPDLARVVAILGEEKRARAVASAIARARQNGPITTTVELADIVAGAVGRRASDKIHPATRTFQALRIFVNRELDELADALTASERILKDGGRLVVVSFHSLEDRIVKRFLAGRSATRSAGSRHMPERQLAPPTFELLTRGALMPGEDEVGTNPRARSARLRAARRTAVPPRQLDEAPIGVPALPDFVPGKG